MTRMLRSLSVAVAFCVALTAGAAAPLPSGAYGPPIPSKGYLVQSLGDGLYWVTDGAYQTMFLTTGEGVIAVDAPPNLGPKYLQAIAEVTREPVKIVIYSHAHKDHIGAASMFPADARYIAQEDTAALLERANDPSRPVPTMRFKRQLTVRLGQQQLELTYNGDNHEPGNIFIYAPRQKVLMLVDVIFPGWVPFEGLSEAKDVTGYAAAHDQVLAYDFNSFIGGHLNRLGTRSDVLTAKAYLADLQANALMALQTVNFGAIAQQVGYENPWLLFSTYLSAVNQTCANATLPNWISRLGGADVYTLSHCATVVASLRVD